VDQSVETLFWNGSAEQNIFNFGFGPLLLAYLNQLWWEEVGRYHNPKTGNLSYINGDGNTGNGF